MSQSETDMPYLPCQGGAKKADISDEARGYAQNVSPSNAQDVTATVAQATAQAQATAREDTKTSSCPGSSEQVAQRLLQALKTENCASCDDVAKHLYMLLDKELSSTDQKWLEAHVSSCPHCAQVTQAELHIREIIRRSCCHEAPVTLREKIKVQLEMVRIKHLK